MNIPGITSTPTENGNGEILLQHALRQPPHGQQSVGRGPELLTNVRSELHGER
jgi:hypothetical protein